LHAAAARRNAGERVSTEDGMTSVAPLRLTTAALAAGLEGGGELVGSGKPEMPCARMHSETLSSCALACAAAAGELAPAPGRMCWQAFWADWNAGALPVAPLIWIRVPPPEVLGSGKFDTPCARMQFEYASAWEYRFVGESVV
jgi:hypothetical protein